MNNKRKVSENFSLMGTNVAVDIIVEENEIADASKAIATAKNIFKKNEKIFSRFDLGSELSKINLNIGKESFVSSEMLEVLILCLKFYKISDGYFDPRIIENLEKIGYDKDFKTNDLNIEKEKELKFSKLDSKLEDDLIVNLEKQTIVAKKRIDTTGIAKGYTVDEVTKYLKQQGFKNFIVDAGGDMFAQGLDENNKSWMIGVEGLEDNKIMLKLEDAGIATSGISRKRWVIGGKKFHHLINPKDPENFSYDIKTVTVISEKTVEADGRAKVLVIMGKGKGMEFANENKLKALFLDYKGNVYLSEAIKENVIRKQL